jgi:hypothetical protein
MHNLHYKFTNHLVFMGIRMGCALIIFIHFFSPVIIVFPFLIVFFRLFGYREEFDMLKNSGKHKGKNYISELEYYYYFFRYLYFG